MFTRTAWNTAITFGWEFEGRDAAVWDWFTDPTTPARDASTWRATPEHERLAWCRTNTWDSLEKRDVCPGFIAGIVAESDPAVYELRSTPCDSIEALRGELALVHAKLNPNAAYAEFQVHIVFRLPPHGSAPENLERHARIAALFQLLNDYVWAKSAQLPADQHYRVYTGPMARKLRRVASRLGSRERPFDEQDKPNKYKNLNVGLRDVYDESDRSIVGFEIRKGVHDNLDRLIRFTELIVAALATDLQNVRLHDRLFEPELQAQAGSWSRRIRQFIPGPGRQRDHYSLAEHYRFSTESGLADVDSALFEQLGNEAHSIIRTSETVPHLARLLQEQGGARKGSREILRHWLLAFRPWEAHPAFRRDPAKRQLIVNSRAALVRSLRAYFAKSDLERMYIRDKSNEAVGFVPREIQRCLASMQLHLNL